MVSWTTRSAAVLLVLALAITGAPAPCPCAHGSQSAPDAHACCEPQGPAVRGVDECCLAMKAPTSADPAVNAAPAAPGATTVVDLPSVAPVAEAVPADVALPVAPQPSPPLVLRV